MHTDWHLYYVDRRDPVERMLDDWKPMSDAMNRYETSMLDAYFPNRYKSGYWVLDTPPEAQAKREADHRYMYCAILTYDWQFQTLFARHVGGP